MFRPLAGQAIQTLARAVCYFGTSEATDGQVSHGQICAHFPSWLCPILFQWRLSSRTGNECHTNERLDNCFSDTEREPRSALAPPSSEESAICSLTSSPSNTMGGCFHRGSCFSACLNTNDIYLSNNNILQRGLVEPIATTWECYIAKDVTGACRCRPAAKDSLGSAAHSCSSLEQNNELLPYRTTPYICNIANLCFSRPEHNRA
jgi:hypothetical protein